MFSCFDDCSTAASDVSSSMWFLAVNVEGVDTIGALVELDPSSYESTSDFPIEGIVSSALIVVGFVLM